MDGTEERRRELAQLMDKRRRDLRFRWAHVAQRTGMSTENLRVIRNGTISITIDAADRIEDALEWQRGSIAAFLADGVEPLPRGEAPSAHIPGAMDVESELMFEGFVTLFRKHRKRMTTKRLRMFLDEVDAELRQRGESQAAEIPVTLDDESHEDGDR